MGFCTYCYQHAGSSYGLSDECYSWESARGCAGITGPNDPKRLERKKVYDLAKAKELRREAKEVRKAAKTKAAELEREAAYYERRHR